MTRMYIAGINRELPFYISHNQGMQGIAVFSTILSAGAVLRTHRAVGRLAAKEAGAVQTETSTLGKVVTAVHSALTALPPIVFALGISFNAFHQPDWIERFSLPIQVDLAVGTGGKAALQTLGCVGVLALAKVYTSVVNHLGAQWSPLGVREKPAIISSGPYAYVRHPMYSFQLLYQLGLSLVFWSYVPLITSALTAAAFAVKIPIEEKHIEENSLVGLEYTAYKSRVRYALIPYIF